MVTSVLPPWSFKVYESICGDNFKGTVIHINCSYNRKRSKNSFVLISRWRLSLIHSIFAYYVLTIFLFQKRKHQKLYISISEGNLLHHCFLHGNQIVLLGKALRILEKKYYENLSYFDYHFVFNFSYFFLFRLNLKSRLKNFHLYFTARAKNSNFVEWKATMTLCNVIYLCALSFTIFFSFFKVPVVKYVWKWKFLVYDNILFPIMWENIFRIQTRFYSMNFSLYFPYESRKWKFLFGWKSGFRVLHKLWKFAICRKFNFPILLFFPENLLSWFQRNNRKQNPLHLSWQITDVKCYQAKKK